MPCAEGERLRDRYFEAVNVKHALQSQTPPEEPQDLRVSLREIERADHFKRECKADLMDHSRGCGHCRPSSNLR
jgi:hypothetical protein